MLVAVFVLAGCTVTIPTSGPRTSSGHDGPSSLDWSACDGDLECASLDVPLDWSEPEGPMIELAVARRPATGPDPIGSLLVNPGGPGEPGTAFLAMWLQSGTVPDELTDRFDLVSWDPRGTGDSAGIACLTDEEFLEPEPLPWPAGAAERDEVVAEADQLRERCLDEHGDTIPHTGTRATVEDLDALRDVLGDDGLTYVGYSYGTTIGLEYLRVHPERVRAMVLDGIAPPGRDPVEATRAQMRSFEDNLDLFLDDCRTAGSCGFGGSDPAAALYGLLDDLADGTRIPASYVLPDESGTPHRREGTLASTQRGTGIATGLYSTDTWFLLRTGLAAATRTDDPDGGILLMLRDLLSGRQLDGSWNHSTEANTAIRCADQTERSPSFFGDRDRMDEWAAQMPVFGRFGAVGLPGCHGWPAALDPLEPATEAGLAAAPDVVVVNSEHDAATPYANALAIRDLLPKASLITWGGEDHTSFAGGFSCVDAAVVPYLVELVMPPAEVRCDP